MGLAPTGAPRTPLTHHLSKTDAMNGRTEAERYHEQTNHSPESVRDPLPFTSLESGSPHPQCRFWRKATRRVLQLGTAASRGPKAAALWIPPILGGSYFGSAAT